MITIVKSEKSEIDFSKPQLLKDKSSELIIITDGKIKKTADGTFIAGTVVNSSQPGKPPGEYKDYWRSDIWEKFKGSITIHSSDND